MAALLNELVRRLIRRGVRGGLLGGDPTWIVVLIVAALVRFLTRPTPERVHTEDLALGESILVRHLPPSKERDDETSEYE